MQALEYRINREIYTPYAGAAGMLLLRNGKFTIGKLKSSLLSYSFVFNGPSLSISRCKSRYEADLTVSVSIYRWFLPIYYTSVAFIVFLVKFPLVSFASLLGYFVNFVITFTFFSKLNRSYNYSLIVTPLLHLHKYLAMTQDLPE